jgi:hypothetical protein
MGWVAWSRATGHRVASSYTARTSTAANGAMTMAAGDDDNNNNSQA